MIRYLCRHYSLKNDIIIVTFLNHVKFLVCICFLIPARLVLLRLCAENGILESQATSIKLFSDDFDQNPLSSSAVKFSVKDLLPGAEIELSLRDCHNHFSPHDLAFQMGIGIILSDIMAILFNRFVGSKFLKPDFEIVVESRFIIINENGGCNVHCVNEYEPLYNSTLSEAFLNFGGNIDEGPSCRYFKPQFFPIAFH